MVLRFMVLSGICEVACLKRRYCSPVRLIELEAERFGQPALGHLAEQGEPGRHL